MSDAGDLRARAVVLATGGYGQVYAATTQPGGRHRRRAGPRPARGRRGRRRRVGAVPPHRALDRSRCRGPAGPGLRGGARRGRRPRRPGRTPDHARAPTRWPTSPPATSCPRPSPPTCTRPARTTSSSTPPHLGADFLARRFPGITRRLPRRRRRPGPRAGPGRAGRALRLRRRGRRPRRPHHGAGPVRRRRGRLHRRPRRQPAGVELHHRGAGGGPPVRRAARCRPARLRRAGRAGRPVEPSTPSRATPSPRPPPGTPACSATRPGLPALARTLATAPRLGPGRPLDLAAVEATALHTVATLLCAPRRWPAPRAAAATGAPTHPGDPARSGRSAWSTASTPPGTCTLRTEPVRTLGDDRVVA